MTWNIVVDSNTLSIVDWYFGDLPVNVTPGITLVVVPPLTWDTVMATRDDSGEITLQEDPTKVQARLDAQWASVRAQQRDLLYKSDWTCSVTDYEVPNKSEWVQYRAALRDVTKQSDPFNIVWPSPPVAN